VSLGGEWDRFALANDAPELAGQNIIDRSLWDFISGDMMRHIYRQLLVLVRSGKSIQYHFRCDSPGMRRFLNMSLTPEQDGGVVFETVVDRVEERMPQEILSRSTNEDGEIVTTCSWCKKIKTGDDAWHEVEEAVQILKLFELDPAPQLSHGMCSACFETAMTQVAGR